MTSHNTPKATHKGELQLGEAVIECFVLEDGRRVIAQAGMFQALERSAEGRRDGVDKLPSFVAARNLQPFLEKGFDGVGKLVEFRPPQGGKNAHGYQAELLTETCVAYVRARRAGALRKNQLHVADAAERLLFCFARVALVALIDEATGFQAERDRDALRRLAQAYIAEEFREWTKFVPDEFFLHLCRLRGWRFNPRNPAQTPRQAGRDINTYVYGVAPAGVLAKLRELNPPGKNGRRRRKHHQHLSGNVGAVALRHHIDHVVLLMRVAANWEHFLLMFEKAFPGRTLQIDLLETEHFRSGAAEQPSESLPR